ncbi:MAG TPA: SpoIID/LytB domain-containing protein, partial [Candidatus Limnocylindrales bacterium]|nr:SpoIID/LytB domain-containing protein [Candidatus Limnocylindrales bacterium]
TVPLEDYVAAALQGESAIFHEQESLKAMAVAVRTYAVHFRARHRDEGFDLCDSTHCQALNFTAISDRVRAASQATRGQLLWYNAAPAATYYHQNCGGTLAAGREVWPDLEAPYLKRRSDPFCLRATPLVWRAEFSREQLDQALRRQGLTLPVRWTGLAITRRSESGRALKLAFLGPGNAQAAISASSLRFAIGRTFGWNRVRSDLYDLETHGDQIIFRGRGAGHGVGLCQNGAEQMAREGKTYRQILDFYYPGAALGLTAQGLAWQERRSDHFLLLSTQPEQDAAVLPRAEAILNSVQADLGWRLGFSPRLRVFPTLDAYRNSTGQPGWIAAFTSAHTISLQPLSVLRKKSALDSTLRHEFVHLLLESRARPDTPLWFREGLALFLAGPGRPQAPVRMTVQEIEAGLEHPAGRESLDRCYAAARARVAWLVKQNGRETVLGWLSGGLPAAAQPAQH